MYYRYNATNVSSQEQEKENKYKMNAKTEYKFGSK
jgi:hypothetical protein